ncbi:unnamed protein product [Parascedosporium putredinis]|uniref:Uncharacterized protein n=1 Tax=Parascedosporium putredinis TaxID=1442378 RepID=A0A9P1MD25_9PEZI|nr:unnamed protein product [Parascedosporium putredinis]CAI7997895.1 unnamed protein product [Parascedosporium putredinis]
MAITKSLTRSASTASLKNRYAYGEIIRVYVGRENREFTLFVTWVHGQASFRKYLDDIINIACAQAADASKGADAAALSQKLHWALVRLHLFASSLDIPTLQDAAMDAIQDLYLRRDWDVTPRFIAFLYEQCTSAAALRIRRWAVAMVSFTLSSTNTLDRSADSVPAQFHGLLKTYPEFSAEYASHIRKMAASGLDIRVKNPQLRIPANRLRNEERRFAFRQCAFHTHRAAVGEKKCPHELAEMKRKRMPIMAPLAEDMSGFEVALKTQGNPDVPQPLRMLRSLSTQV